MDSDYPQNLIGAIRVVRSEKNPLMTPRSDATLGDNINGPSVIRVPSWVECPLGRYYMYFAHHSGRHIRLAYADCLHGPWTVYAPGVLGLDQAPMFRRHIASPDVHVDKEKQEIRMYYHGSSADGSGQKTAVAFSKNALDFSVSNAILGNFYFRVFRHGGWYYAIAKDGNSGWGELLRSRDGITPFERRSQFLAQMRHAAALVRDDVLLVFYSRKGDSPERIVLATVKLTDDWRAWRESEPMEVIRPEKDYEGIAYPTAPSDYGLATHVCQLRDPCIFEDGGRLYLFYTVAGEMGIALAELEITMREPGALE